jgi:hypothetical protein
MRLLRRLSNGAEMSDAKFMRFYVELFLGGNSYGKPREYQVGGICFWRPAVSQAQHELG